MAVYYWVGGYTGGTGPESGYSAGTNTWTNLDTGKTSGVGDVWFSPYAWRFPQNWRKQDLIPNTGLYAYTIPDISPVGGEATEIIFGGATDGSSGKQINPYKYSLLFGGFSGDGWTASGSTAWHGATTHTGKFSPINFVVLPDYSLKNAAMTITDGSIYGATNAPFVPTVDGVTASRCMIGRGLYGSRYSLNNTNAWFSSGFTGMERIGTVQYSRMKPLNVRTQNFVVQTMDSDWNMSPGSSTGAYGFERSPLIAINNPIELTGTETQLVSAFQQYPPSLPQHSKSSVLSYITGWWTSVQVDNGSLHANGCTGRTMIARGWIENFVSNNNNQYKNYLIAPANAGNFAYSSVNQGIWIKGNGGTAAETVSIYGWSGQNENPMSFDPQDLSYGTTRTVKLGMYGIGDSTSTSTIDNLIMYRGINELRGAPVLLGNVVINNLQLYQGRLYTLIQNEPYDSIYIKNGYAGNSTYQPGATRELHMYHPQNMSWTNFNLGYTASDEGLRIDSTDVKLYFYDGQRVRGQKELSITGNKV
jgi:hypothetical protein